MSFGSVSYIQEHLNISQNKSKPAGPQQEKPDQNMGMSCVRLFGQQQIACATVVSSDYNGAEIFLPPCDTVAIVTSQCNTFLTFVMMLV